MWFCLGLIAVFLGWQWFAVQSMQLPGDEVGDWEEDDRSAEDRLDMCRIDHSQRPLGLAAEDYIYEIDVQF